MLFNPKLPLIPKRMVNAVEREFYFAVVKSLLWLGCDQLAFKIALYRMNEALDAIKS